MLNPISLANAHMHKLSITYMHATTIILIMHYYSCIILNINITTSPSFNVNAAISACLLLATGPALK